MTKQLREEDDENLGVNQNESSHKYEDEMKKIKKGRGNSNLLFTDAKKRGRINSFFLLYFYCQSCSSNKSFTTNQSLTSIQRHHAQWLVANFTSLLTSSNVYNISNGARELLHSTYYIDLHGKNKKTNKKDECQQLFERIKTSAWRLTLTWWTSAMNNITPNIFKKKRAEVSRRTCQCCCIAFDIKSIRAWLYSPSSLEYFFLRHFSVPLVFFSFFFASKILYVYVRPVYYCLNVSSCGQCQISPKADQKQQMLGFVRILPAGGKGEFHQYYLVE